MADGRKLTLVIPALNEAENLVLLFPRFKQVVSRLQKQNIEVELLLVNDGSTDSTAEVARQNGAVVISHPFNLGVCAALHSGFLYARQKKSDFLITVDADGQHNPEDIVNLIDEFLRRKVDVLIGSRFLQETGYKKNACRFFGIRLFSLLVYSLTKLKIYDVTSGFRVFGERAIRFLAVNFPQDYPDAEILILLSKSGYRIEEFALSMNPRMFGRSQHNFKTAVTYPFKNMIAIIVVLLRTLFHKQRMEA
ncbi:glycosyltransferase family 2 protein [candidate division KSB1 bacterium]|nr:glycosyltransferase family 2 protein [candidate division KSB1 bacterium]